MTARIPSILVVGLGNYTHPLTRHSVGQLIVESFAARLGITLKDDRATMSWIGQKEVDIYPPLPTKGQQRSKKLAVLADSPVPPLRVNVVLVKPKLLMNISGKAAALAYRAYIRPQNPSHVIVLHDSLSHKPMSLHPRQGGSANGHNGVAHLVSTLQGPNFHRIRVGIGRPENNGRYDGYVLEKLDARERDWWGSCGEGTDRAWTTVEGIIGSVLEPPPSRP